MPSIIRIQKIEINSFGKLKDFTLDFEKGLNIVCAPNEWGKSSIADFIKYIFFGFQRQRGARKTSDPSANEQLRYTPWEGGFIGGGITFECDNAVYHAQRSTDKRDRFSCVNASTGEQFFEGAQFGEALFGVDLDSFSRTAFIGQSSVDMSGSGELETKIRNLVTSGDEDVSFEKAFERLENELRVYKHKGRAGGKIFNIEKEIIAKKEELQQAAYNYKALKELELKRASFEKELSRIHRDYAETEKKRERHAAVEKARNLLKAEKLEAELADFEAELDKEKENLPDNAGEYIEKLILDEGRLGAAEAAVKEAESRFNDAQTELRRAGENTGKAAKKISQGIFILSGAALFAGAMLALFLNEFTTLFASFPYLIIYGIGLAGISLLAVGTVKNILFRVDLKRQRAAAVLSAQQHLEICRKNRSEAQEKSAEIKKALFKEGVTPENIRATITNQRERLENVNRLTAQISILKRSLYTIKGEDSTREDCAEEETSYKNFTQEELNIVFEERAEDLSRRMRELREEEISKQAAVKEINGKLALLSKVSPIELEEEIEALENEREECRKKAGQIELAQELLRESFEILQNRLAPEINSKAQRYFEVFSAGRYDNVLLNHKFDIKIKVRSEFQPVSYFSAGTRDAAYLAARLAVCDLIFDRAIPPLIFDDSFSRIDDMRLKTILQSLETLAHDRQIIIFSCHSREKELAGSGRLELLNR